MLPSLSITVSVSLSFSVFVQHLSLILAYNFLSAWQASIVFTTQYLSSSFRSLVQTLLHRGFPKDFHSNCITLPLPLNFFISFIFLPAYKLLENIYYLVTYLLLSSPSKMQAPRTGNSYLHSRN